MGLWLEAHIIQYPKLTVFILLIDTPFRDSLFYFLFLLFPKRGEGKEKERERNIDWLSLAPAPVKTETAIWVLALTRNWTCDLSVCEMTPSQLRRSGKGFKIFYLAFRILDREISWSISMEKEERKGIKQNAEWRKREIKQLNIVFLYKRLIANKEN